MPRPATSGSSRTSGISLVILVMEQGGIVEHGTHAELIKSEGAYWRLYNSQFEQAATDLDAEEALHEGPQGADASGGDSPGDDSSGDDALEASTATV